MKDLSKITETIGGYKLLTPIIKHEQVMTFYHSMIIWNGFIERISWDRLGTAMYLDGRDIDNNRLNINLKSPYEALLKKVQNCTETIGGNKVYNLTVLDEEHWDKTQYIITGFLVFDDELLGNSSWTIEGFMHAYASEHNYNLKF